MDNEFPRSHLEDPPLPFTESMLFRLMLLPIELLVTVTAALALMVIVILGLLVETVAIIKDKIFSYVAPSERH